MMLSYFWGGGGLDPSEHAFVMTISENQSGAEDEWMDHGEALCDDLFDMSAAYSWSSECEPLAMEVFDLDGGILDIADGLDPDIVIDPDGWTPFDIDGGVLDLDDGSLDIDDGMDPDIVIDPDGWGPLRSGWWNPRRRRWLDPLRRRRWPARLW